MNDPSRPPGIAFVGLRLVRSQYDYPAEQPVGVEGESEISYGDSVKVEGSSITVRQQLGVQVLNPAKHDEVFLRVFAEVEGKFVASPDANLDATEFANNHAPAILFAFTREWIHKLTSAAAPWPPILLPPMNVMELRKQVKPAAK